MTKKKSKASPLREKEFKARLKKIFPLSSSYPIKFTYSALNYKHTRSEKLKAEGTLGYHEKESILVGDKSIDIAWLPHVKDMSSSYLDELLKRVVPAVREALLGNDLDDDSDIPSLSIG